MGDSILSTKVSGAHGCLALFLFFFFVVGFGSYPLATTMITIPALLLLAMAALAQHRRMRKSRDRAFEAATSLIQKHIQALYRQRIQKRRQDAYGNIIDRAWLKERQYFYDNVFSPLLAEHTQFLPCELVHEMIEQQLDSYSQTDCMKDLDLSAISPLDFEARCAEVLNQSGWMATITKASGDQGADIIATRNGIRAVFQCKLQSSSVGNKAVQEALAGKTYEAADLAFVVSNKTYTPSAVDLANKAGVILLHYTELSRLDEPIDKERASSRR